MVSWNMDITDTLYHVLLELLDNEEDREEACLSIDKMDEERIDEIEKQFFLASSIVDACRSRKDALKSSLTIP